MEMLLQAEAPALCPPSAAVAQVQTRHPLRVGSGLCQPWDAALGHHFRIRTEDTGELMATLYTRVGFKYSRWMLLSTWKK